MRPFIRTIKAKCLGAAALGVAALCIAIPAEARTEYVTTAKVHLRSLAGMLEKYRATCGGYPTTEQGLDALTRAPCKKVNARPLLADERVPLDPWGHHYLYSSDGKTFEITCFGRDGKEGGEGPDADIRISNDKE